jgi:carboxymethylenebutenolidase
MIEKAIEIPTADGTADGYLCQPETGGPWPGVVYYVDIMGIRPANREIAKRIAANGSANGYVVLLPNVFYRTGPPPSFEFKPDFTDDRTKKRFSELAAPLTPEAMVRDGSTYVDFLAKQPSVAKGPFGVIGTCFTGSMALRTAASRPEKIAAVASFHGGWLHTDQPTSPHLLLPQIKARLFFAHATNDPYIPAESIAKLEQALAAWGGKYESRTFGAAHGWTVPGSPVYNEREAEAAFAKLMELFSATIANPAASRASS